MITVNSDAMAQQAVSFPTPDGGLVYADMYGKGSRAVVLAHGMRFNKESWSEQARTLADAGFCVRQLTFAAMGNRGARAKAIR